MRVLVVFGTRPEAIKCFPVVKELQKRPDVDVRVCITAQHRQILDQMLQLVELVPDYDLNIMREKPTLTDITSDVLIKVGEILDQYQPDRVIVQGDTTTTFATALAAFYRKIPVGHIEAGLRSWDLYSPWPEEANRRFVSVVGDLHFAPTQKSRANLLSENISEKNIFVTGNTVVDALNYIRRRMSDDNSMFSNLDQYLPDENGTRKLVLVTTHRRENWENGLQNILEAIITLSQRPDVHIVLPVHPNPNVKIPVYEALDQKANINLIEPQDYLPFVYLMKRSHIILTDSGGVQEEAPALGKPVLVLRNTTERPEGIESGNALLVGTDRDKIITEAERLLDDPSAYSSMSHASNPYGDGTASVQIVNHILSRHRI